MTTAPTAERQATAKAAPASEECFHAGEDCADPERCRCQCEDCAAAYEKMETEEEMESGS